MRSLPPINGLSAGFAGEFSHDARQLISADAEKGAVMPERFGCCSDSDQARDVIASFERRSFGQTSLSGVARCEDPAGFSRGYPWGSNVRRLLCRRRHGGRRERMGRVWRARPRRCPAPVVNWGREIAAPDAGTGPLLT